MTPQEIFNWAVALAFIIFWVWYRHLEKLIEVLLKDENN
jgi:hypothetical protein